MSSQPLDTKHTAKIHDLAEKARRARRLAADVTDPAVRRSLLEWALENEAGMTELLKTEDARQTK